MCSVHLYQSKAVCLGHTKYPVKIRFLQTSNVVHYIPEATTYYIHREVICNIKKYRLSEFDMVHTKNDQ